MKVVLVSNPPDESSGTGQYTEQLARALDPRVDLERVFVPVDARSPLPYLRAATDRTLVGADVVHVQHDYVVFGPRGIYVYLFFPLLYLASLAVSFSTVVTVHEALNGDLVSAPLRRLKRIYVDALNRTISGAADSLVFLSEQAEARFSASVTGTPSKQIPHGVVDVPFDTSPDEARRLFGYAPDDDVIVEPGYVSPRKGSDVFVSLAERCPDYEFLLAGGAPRPAQESYVAELRRTAPENVTVTGRLSSEEFHAAFEAADVAVLPYNEVSQTGVVNAVNQSGVFNWCAAHRVPVAASNCPRFRAVNDRWGCPRLFDVTDVEEMASCVRTLLEEGEREPLRSALAAYADSNDIDSVAARYVDVYEEVV